MLLLLLHRQCLAVPHLLAQRCQHPGGATDCCCRCLLTCRQHPAVPLLPAQRCRDSGGAVLALCMCAEQLCLLRLRVPGEAAVSSVHRLCGVPGKWSVCSTNVMLTQQSSRNKEAASSSSHRNELLLHHALCGSTGGWTACCAQHTAACPASR